MDAEPERRGAVALLPFLAAAAVAVVGIAIVVVVNLASGPPSVHRVTLDVDAAPPVGWSLTGAAQLDSSDGRTTVLEVEVRRNDAGTAAPALTADFDGSGGGEALVVTCRTAAGTGWTVATGDAQLFRLACDRSVAPKVLQDVASVHLATAASG